MQSHLERAGHFVVLLSAGCDGLMRPEPDADPLFHRFVVEGDVFQDGAGARGGE